MFAGGAQCLPVARKFAGGINMFAAGVPQSVCEFRAEHTTFADVEIPIRQVES